MDAIKFIEERNRMCNSYEGSCAFCPATGEHCSVGMKSCLSADEQVEIVEKWSSMYPRKTRQSVFLEQWPDATKDENGVLALCPKYLSVNIGCVDKDRFKDCDDCRREFWMQEVK